jgi:hypothetical protein
VSFDYDAIYVDREGRPIAVRPDRDEFPEGDEGTLEFHRARWAYADKVQDHLARAFGETFHRAVRRTRKDDERLERAIEATLHQLAKRMWRGERVGAGRSHIDANGDACVCEDEIFYALRERKAWSDLLRVTFDEGMDRVQERTGTCAALEDRDG